MTEDRGQIEETGARWRGRCQGDDTPPHVMNGGPTNGGGFWKITVGGVTQILLLLGTVLAFFLTYDRSLNDTKNIANQNARDISSLAKTVSDMNILGTSYSRLGIPLETTAINNLSERSNRHDVILSDLAPKIERMQTTLEFMRDYIQEQKNRK